MSKSNDFENDLLKLIFNGTTIEGLADNDATGALTNLYLGLHTADPGEAGTQATSECAYVGYARIALVRTSGGWTITGNSVSPNANVDFAAAQAGTTPETATHMSVGVAASGATKYLYSGTITPNIAISVGVAPRLTPSTVITED